MAPEPALTLPNSRPVVSVRGIDKRYAGIQAVRGVDLDLYSGSVHALVGENGAGKSTLGKIICGAVRPDDGQILFDGAPRRFRSPRDALRAGAALIAQELELVPELTAEANVLLGFEQSYAGLLGKRSMKARYREIASRLGCNVPGSTVVASLGMAEKQQLEIMRAVARDARLIVMDEPTSALTPDEKVKLHAVIRDLASGGTTIVYVSHFLNEVLSIADWITVMRNGSAVTTAPAAEETEASLVRAMLGRAASIRVPRPIPCPPDAAVVVQVSGLGLGEEFQNINLNIRAGEIVGLAGLLGCGRSQLGRALFGASKPTSGSVEIGGEARSCRSPRQAIRSGVALIPESRKEEGLVMGLDVGRNITLPHLATVSSAGMIRGKAARSAVDRLLQQLGVTPPSAATNVSLLSGGNQQKVLFGKWLYGRPRFIILDEPTRGVDVGARRTIYELICSLAENGLAVLLLSSELEELTELSHRVMVMAKGRIVQEFTEYPFPKDALMRSAFGLTSETAA